MRILIEHISDEDYYPLPGQTGAEILNDILRERGEERLQFGLTTEELTYQQWLEERA